jgi:pectate lyase
MPHADAAITFDAAARAATTSTGKTSLAWTHTIGSGTNRILMIGVSVANSNKTVPAVTSVVCNGVAATAVANSEVHGGGTGIIETELFFVLDGNLPSSGSFPVTVTFQSGVTGAAAGSVSLFGVNQSAPEAVATNVDTSGADTISTAITTHTAGAWVLDVVGSGTSGQFTPGSGQVERWDIAASTMTGASDTKTVATAGSTTVTETHSGANRLAHSLASFAPAGGGGGTTFTLSVNVVGSGTVIASPPGPTYPAGTVVTLTATAAVGFQFAGWSGAITSTANPVTVTMDANKSVTATFATVNTTFTLTTNVVGSGAVAASPTGPTYAAGTVVTLTATASAGFSFAGWSGDLVSTANPATITMNANKSVTATFTSSTTPDFHLFGFAAGVTTGGKGGTTVTATTLADLKTFAASTSAMIIQVSGGFTGPDEVRVASNKTIVGVGSGATFVNVEINLQGSSNIIVRNLNISKVLASNNDGDAIHLQDTHDVWIDHCELSSESPQTQPNKDLYDGLSDLTHDTSNVTISWCFFHDHWKTDLIGSSDSDNFDRRATFHHNLYQNVASRLPSYRFGTGHVYNTYFNGVLTSGVNSRMGAVLRIEGNVFQDATDPITSVDSSQVGFWDVRDNQFINCTGSQPTTSNGAFSPPYSYILDSSANVKAIVTQFAGVGKTNPLQNLP